MCSIQDSAFDTNNVNGKDNTNISIPVQNLTNDIEDGAPSRPKKKTLEELLQPEIKSKPAKKPFCMKCKTQPPVVTIRSAQFCKDCFFHSIGNRFRSHLKKKEHELKDGDSIMVAFSGGIGSRALLDLMHDFHCGGVVADGRSKQKFKDLVVGHVNESICLVGEDTTTTISDQQDAQIKEIVDSYNLKLFTARLEDIFNPDVASTLGFDVDTLIADTLSLEAHNLSFQSLTCILKDSSSSDPNGTECNTPINMNERNKRNRQRLLALIRAFNKQSTLVDLLNHFKRALLAYLAIKANCQALFLGESATRTAINVIANTSKGRGYSLPLDIASEAPMYGGRILFSRPLRDILSKELAIYNSYRSLYTTPFLANSSTKKDAKSSIDRLTEEFIVGLQRDFPSTVSAVTRTANKVTTPVCKISTDDKTIQSCVICRLPVQPGAREWRARHTVMDLNRSAKNADENELDSEMVVELLDFMCYGCQNMALDVKPMVKAVDNGGNATEDLVMPPFVTFGVMDRRKMKQEIQDFLLGEEEEEE